jgi:surface carbohydrate biosynthesis protein
VQARGAASPSVNLNVRDMEKPAFYFDVETKKRELLSRALLAAALADRGCHAVVGSRTTAAALGRVMTGATVVRKSISPNEAEVIRGLTNAGHKCVAMDEEGLLVDGLDRFADLRHSRDTVRATEMILAWGPMQAKFLGNYFGCPEKFRSAGNPRVVLWSNRYFGYFDEAVREIQARHGEFTLIASNFAFHTNRVLCEKMLAGTGYLDSERNRALHVEHVARVDFIFERFVDLARTLSERGEKVVFRPHPSDNAEYVRQRLADCANVEVIGTGEVAPWILAARNLVHNCCTTAVEGAFMGTRVVSYCPSGVAQYELDAVNRLGVIVETNEDALNALDESDRAADPEARFIGGFLEADAPLSKMADLVLETARPGRLRPELRGAGFYAWQSRAMGALRKIKDAGILDPIARTERQTFRSKFPPTYAGEIDRFLDCLRDRGVVKRTLRARMVGDSTFYLQESW